jgi:hypothetical protein
MHSRDTYHTLTLILALDVDDGELMRWMIA